LAVVGQFNPIYDGEKNKAAETMWVQTEVWDQLAEDNKSILKKGLYICGVGSMHYDKWLDKNTGEERKTLKLRVQKFITKDQLSSLLEIVNKEEIESEESKVFEDSKLSKPHQSFKTIKMSDISLPEGMSGDNEDDPENEEEVVELKKMWPKKAPVPQHQSNQ